MNIRCLTLFLLFGNFVHAQTVDVALKNAVKKFEADSQLTHALYSLYVLDATTGKPVFEKNSQVGLATASCLKLVTSATAFELLGSDFRYHTNIGYHGAIENGTLNGNLYITGSGDPTLGSWRWEHTKVDAILTRISGILAEKNIKKINGQIIIDDYGFQGHHIVPNGWTWDDLGNYYGAPARILNWNENQYDITYKTTAIRGEKAKITRINPPLPGVHLNNYVTAGPKGSGDRTIIYLPPFSNSGYITGTVPAGENAFTASGSMPNPTDVFIQSLREQLTHSGIIVTDSIYSLLQYREQNTEAGDFFKEPVKPLGTVTSPSLDSMNYWFMRRSINLYGEAFLRTRVTGKKRSTIVSYREALDSVKQFWKTRGIEPAALNMYDGSGLSPQNRVTTTALVKILQYAKTRPWFSAYYNGFPEYNGMKLKSGTIGDVKGFAGYHKAKNGKDYIIAFLVNNYNGASSALVGKMYKVLDVLK